MTQPSLCKSSISLANVRERAEMQIMNPIRNSPLGLSTSQAAEALGVSLGTIRRWSDMGHLKSYRTPGGQRRFSTEQIEEFLEKLQRGGVEAQDEARVAS